MGLPFFHLRPRLIRALQGELLAVFAPLGWLAIQVARGGSPLDILTQQAGLFAYMLLGSLLAFGTFGWLLGKEQERLAQLATIDELTGLANTRHFRQRMSEFAHLSQRQGRPMSLLLVDLDRFKGINDTYGHQVGDMALKTAAEVIRSAVRRCDIAARIGGEEFALLLPDTGTSEASHVAKRILRAFSQATVMTGDGREVGISASIGVSGGVPSCQESTECIFEDADKALYRAKAEGRGRMVMA